MSSQDKKTPTVIAPMYKLTATHALELINNNTISVEEYAKSLLDRIEERDLAAKAWAYLGAVLYGLLTLVIGTLTLNRSCLCTEPGASPRQGSSKQEGPLHGLPIGIKDIMNTKDMPTQYGSPIYQGH
ncbi:hypothetical protein EDB82DRAFT_502204 [Fusarium venenatum]|uniref:uncharacterized protein n=1 Tax=Fusarium venenatum TaxID=56646 RepID=UPI001DE713B1|nr:hypothetical protein EDB82DRAFT_502204 [Fusarium venenatum]